MFTNRKEAGILLAEKLKIYRNKPTVVLAIPRGGLPVGAEIAKKLNAPLDVVLSKKIGHPYNKEFAIGAVSLKGIILSSSENIPDSYIKSETEKIRELLEFRHRQYHQDTSPASLDAKVVIIVDDGIATGNTLLSTVALVADENPTEIVVAIPVSPPSSLQKLKNSTLINLVVCLETPSNFQAVGQFYEEFNPVTDEEAITILTSVNAEIRKKGFNS